MRSPSQFRSGSALLIVLGMVAFMLFSGLAFSVYMRYSRLPTSFLRRTTTTHQLARAAVAEAIEAIDKAIGNDPHPGVRRADSTTANYWYNRVFFGTEQTSDPTYDSDTVATLTLEGLAYLPPNMINDIRYYSRCTPTAKWHSFWFDSGRYAYTAIDVSDYFDVNKLRADKRASSALLRISLAHIFEENGNELHSGAGDGADDWDKWLEDDEKVRKVDKTTGEITFDNPFVSLADFNIAWTKEFSIGGEAVKCPFRRFIEEGTPYGENLKSSDPKCEAYKNLTFVTDSWTPADSVGKTPDGKRETVDLASEQPFDINDLNQTTPSLESGVMRYSSPLLKTNDKRANLYDHICMLAYAQLWDYLDPDNIPVSLAIPTLERVPMIVGVQPNLLPSLQIEKGEKKDSDVSGGDTTRKRRREQVYNLRLASQNVSLRVLAAYPFRSHGIEEQNDSYTVGGRLALFFTSDGGDMPLRPGDANEAFQLKKNDLTACAVLNDSVMSIPLPAKGVSAKEIAEKEKKDQPPVMAVPLTGAASSDLTGGTKFLTVVYEWEQTKTKAGWVPENPTEKDIVADGTEFAFCPLGATGAKDKVPTDFVKNLQNGTAVKLKVNAAVWARVSQGDKTVDLVPACLMDDTEMNGGNNGSSMMNQLGKAYPLMRYNVKANGQDELELTIAKLDAGQQIPLTIDNAKTFVSDPRYNHMPENWYTVSGTGDLSEQEWMTETAKMLGQDGRDSDIYMATSDQGYLQSIYELAYLPRFTGFSADRGDARFGNYITSRSKNIETDFQDLPTDYSQVLDANMMWRTYRCYGDNRDDFENIGFVCGATGPRVNPYSDSTNVLMAAFANTPHDWRLSVTNRSDLKEMDAATFNGKHAWNAYSSEKTGRICWDCLSKVAGAFSYHTRSMGSSRWQDVFASLDWDGSGGDVSKRNRYLAGVELDSDDSNLYDVDKKFLYGFWHDSFGVGQQLFLVFVRAEPMMMGGGVAGQAPPQLGARAVALVWRDPSDTLKSQSQQGTQDASVHRTRILFYHLFD